MPLSTADPAAYVALGMQSALGTPQSTPAKFRFAKYLSGTDVQPVEEVVDLREGGDGLDHGFSYKKSQKAQGQIVLNARPEFLGQLLSVLPGGATWDGGSAPAIHTYHTGHASHPWASLQIAHPATSILNLLSDVRFTGLSLEYMSGEPVKITAPYVAITHGASSGIALVPSYNDFEPFLFHSEPSYILDGTADSNITGFKLDLTLGVEELQSQAVTLDEIVVQNRDQMFEFTRRYENATLWKKIHMGGGVTPTTSVATGSFEGIVAFGAAGEARRLFRLYLPLLSYRSNALTELDPDGRTVMETVQARVLKGGTHAAILQLHNAHPSAYAA